MNPEQWLSLKWNGGSTMSDRWLNQSKIIHQKCRIDEKFSEALLQLLVLFQSFRINHRLKRYTKILQGFTGELRYLIIFRRY